MYVLPTRDPAQSNRGAQTESEGMGKIFHANGNENLKSSGSNTYIRQNRLQTKAIARDKEG